MVSLRPLASWPGSVTGGPGRWLEQALVNKSGRAMVIIAIGGTAGVGKTALALRGRTA
jgi:hypothetical protein